jgi:hypothetical protein
MTPFSCFWSYRAPWRPKTKIPRNFYIDGTYFEPQKQAKPRTLKMAELALTGTAGPRDHDHKNATSHGTTHGTVARALTPPRRDITTHGTTVRGGRRRDARDGRWRGALCCVAPRVACAQGARARGECERRQWLRGAAVGHVPLPQRGGRALARAVVERLTDASHKATSRCSSCCRRRRSTRPTTTRRPPTASSCAD